MKRQTLNATSAISYTQQGVYNEFINKLYHLDLASSNQKKIYNNKILPNPRYRNKYIRLIYCLQQYG